MSIENMSDFFAARVGEYDNHMLNNVEGCKQGYEMMASLVPTTVKKLLDLGCGTGLELDEIFKLYPNIEVTGIDLTKEMLDELKRKNPDKKLNLINDSYLGYDFGIQIYDTAVSFQTLHHFTHDQKVDLYANIAKSLISGGKYIECDYMVEDQATEDLHFKILKEYKEENNIPSDEFLHYDTPCTIDNQIKLLKMAGFSEVEKVWRSENTTILVASK